MNKIWGAMAKDIWEYVIVKYVVGMLFHICHYLKLSKWAYKLAVNNIQRERNFLMIMLERGNLTEEEEKETEEELATYNNLLETAYEVKKKVLL